MMAIINGQPVGMVSGAEATAGAAARAWPPNAKQAATSSKKEAALTVEVTSCVPLPQRIPRHCTKKKTQIMPTAIVNSCLASAGKKSQLYSAMTMETAAAVPHVESQSLHPTMKPAYSPMARREKLYWPPLRGIEAPSSASEEAPKNAYSPPTIHTPMKSHAFGSIFAMSPGVRTIPAPMAFPMVTVMTRHPPRTCSNLPEPRVCGPATAMVLVEDSSDVLDNVESQECIENSAIIMAGYQNASWKS